jgi:hypothetical protein
VPFIYEQEHLKLFEGRGEVLEEEQHWCAWLKEKAPRLIDEFTTAARFPASAAIIKAQWERWIHERMFTLVEMWREDYNGRKKA